MKSEFLITLGLIAFTFTSEVFGQGTLNFANLAGGVNAPVTNTVGSRIIDPSYVADLFFSSNTNAPTDLLQAAGFNIPFSTTTANGGGYFLWGNPNAERCCRND